MPFVIDDRSVSLPIIRQSANSASSASGLGDFAVSIGQAAAARASKPTFIEKAKDLFGRALDFVAPVGLRADSKLRRARADFGQAVGDLLGVFKPNHKGGLNADAFVKRLQGLRQAGEPLVKLGQDFSREFASQLTMRMDMLSVEQRFSLRESFLQQRDSLDHYRLELNDLAARHRNFKNPRAFGMEVMREVETVKNHLEDINAVFDVIEGSGFELAVAGLKGVDSASYIRLTNALTHKDAAARLLRQAPATHDELAAHLLELEHAGAALEQRITELNRLQPLASPEAQVLSNQLVEELALLGDDLKARRGEVHGQLIAPFDSALGALLAAHPLGLDGQGVIQRLAALREAAEPLANRGVDFAELLTNYLEVRLNDLTGPQLDGLARALNTLVSKGFKDEFKRLAQRHEEVNIKAATLGVDRTERARRLRDDFDRIAAAVNAKVLERFGVNGEVSEGFRAAFLDKVMQPPNQAMSLKQRLGGEELSVCRQCYADLLRADYTVRDADGRCAPLLDHGAYDFDDEEQKAACLRAKVEALEDFCGGDGELTFQLSQWLNQATFAGFTKALRSNETPLEMGGGKVEPLTGVEPSYELSKAADGAITVAFRYRQMPKIARTQQEEVVELDPTASLVSLSTVMTLRKGQAPSFGPIQYAYRLVRSENPRA
ncbi:MAG: hypothetical protein U1F68_00380 [Gammaproteobacteria bacterium]